MLRSVFHLLVNLHPRAFRERFAAEMLSIFDHSTGRKAAFSLVVDAWLSLLRQWGFRPAFWNDAVAVEQPQAASAGAPSFFILETPKLRGIALLHGGILSLVFFIVVSLAVLNSRGSRIQPKLPRIVPDTSWGATSAEKSDALEKALEAARARNPAAPDARSATLQQRRTAAQQSAARAGSPGIAISASPDTPPPATLAPPSPVADDSSPQISWPIVPDENATPVPPGKAIAIAPAPPLPSYEGTYTVNPPNSFKVEITAEGDQLFLSSSGKLKTALVPCSETSFRFEDSTVCGITFSKFDQGEFHQLAILHGNTRSIALR
ncbi:MAG: hypothetical protein WA857_00170 [Candidatus Acidiferrum sp.]